MKKVHKVLITTLLGIYNTDNWRNNYLVLGEGPASINESSDEAEKKLTWTSKYYDENHVKTQIERYKYKS